MNTVLAAETHAVPLGSTRMCEQEAIITVTTDDMTRVITSLTEGTLAIGETLVTVHATTTMTATDVAMIVTATLRSGIMIVPATNVTTMNATADMTRVMVHRVDVPGAVGEVSDHGHRGVVHLPEIVALDRLHHRIVAHHTGAPQVPVWLQT